MKNVKTNFKNIKNIKKNKEKMNKDIYKTKKEKEEKTQSLSRTYSNVTQQQTHVQICKLNLTNISTTTITAVHLVTF